MSLSEDLKVIEQKDFDTRESYKLTWSLGEDL